MQFGVCSFLTIFVVFVNSSSEFFVENFCTKNLRENLRDFLFFSFRFPMCPALGKECLKKMFNPNSYSLANSILRQLPVVSNPPNFVGKVPGATFSEVKTTPIGDPKLIAKSDDCLSSILDLDPDAVANDPNFIDFVSGNKIPYSPLSHRYGGHQFAVWADQLGDGRAHLIGEYLNRKGTIDYIFD